MDSHRVTRRVFLASGVASAVALGAALDAALAASAVDVRDGDYVVGRFVSAQGARSGVVSVDGGRSVSVMLDAEAFIVHGTDGIVDGLTAFVPGEEVLVRGATTELGIAAVEFQSVYTGATGTVTPDGRDYVLVTSSGRRVRVPRDVAHRRLASGVSSGTTYAATIWTDPETGDATAVVLGSEG